MAVLPLHAHGGTPTADNPATIPDRTGGLRGLDQQVARHRVALLI
jgi:hypothetical protein